jgi:hypothetical protein
MHARCFGAAKMAARVAGFARAMAVAPVAGALLWPFGDTI